MNNGRRVDGARWRILMNRWGREGRDDYLMVDVDDNGCGWVMALL